MIDKVKAYDLGVGDKLIGVIIGEFVEDALQIAVKEALKTDGNFEIKCNEHVNEEPKTEEPQEVIEDKNRELVVPETVEVPKPRKRPSKKEETLEAKFKEKPQTKEEK